MYYVIIINDHFHDVAVNNDLIYMKKNFTITENN